MIIKNLYKTGHAVGPIPSNDGQAVHGYRLIADGNGILENTKTKETALCIDIKIEEKEDWVEDTEELSYEEIGKILSGDGEKDD